MITRRDLDRFVDAFSPAATEQARRRLGVQYARTLVYSALAQQQGLEKDPTFAKELAAQLEIVKSRALASAFLQKLQAKTTAITDAEVQKYYDLHRDEYEQAQIRRLSVPLEVPTEIAHPLTRAAVKPYMEELRKRAAAGEDFNLLQQDAFQFFHIQATPPLVNLTTVDRRSMQGEEAKALDLNPGEVSDVLDALAAVVIIKVESKNVTPLGAVHQEIETTLRAARTQNLLNRLTKDVSTDFNLPYFGMTSQPDIFGSAVNGPTQARASMQLPSGEPRK
ncbi:MAG TPA: peptidylprolyl isomerase [Bryobacteraceae bacterium]|nr:peptidylprolyl isomerase [Bryobacteraceae bacterium]